MMILGLRIGLGWIGLRRYGKEFFFSLSFFSLGSSTVVLKNRDGKRGIKKEILFIAVYCDEVRKKIIITPISVLLRHHDSLQTH